jgi:DNA repair exonuclease SbcCD ATPase subunit|tara:strand:- start:430 stop:2220 length:1791 start_codon:yes stop_codon:yes gene_type:complete
MIILKTLRWDNCFSYGRDNILDLNDSNLTQLVGTNGMGKSSIPLIIEEVLFNKNSKGIKKQEIQNRFVNDGYSINLTFQVDENDYEIDVSRKASIKCKLYKNGDDISSHTATNTYKTVQDLLGLDFKTFTQLVYQNTNTSLQFLTATDTNRKKFLIDLLKLEEYVEFFDIFKEAARDISFEVNNLNGKSDTIVKWLEENKLESMDILPILNLPKFSESDEQQLQQLRHDFEKISENNKKIIDNNFIKDRLTEQETNEHRLFKGEEISLTAMLQQLGTFSSKEAEAQAHMDKIDTLEGQCPTCEQELDWNELEKLNLDYLNAKTNAHNNQVILQEKIAEAKKHNKLCIIRDSQQREYEDLIRDWDNSLPSTILDGEDISSQIDELSSNIASVRNRIEGISASNLVAERHNTRISIIQEQSEGMETQLEEVVAALGKIEEQATHLEILKKAFSTNGLLAYKIENLVKDLEDLTNEYLAELSSGRFSLEFVVTNDKLNVEITDNSKVVDILALSSGELARVNTATLLAIRKLMSSISSSRINTLFLDEIISVLDDEGKEKLVEILLGEELNTYLVSHGWTHPLLSKIEVIKEDNISRLE